MRRARSVFYVLPVLAVLAATAFIPLARTFQLAFTDARLGTLEQAKFIGLENFVYLAKDPWWWRSVWNTLQFAFLSVGLETALGLAIALLLDSKLKLRGPLRAATLIPWAIPAVVSARMWAWMLNDLHGIVNELLLKAGLIHERIAWLADDRLALVATVLVDAWKTTPFMALLLLAGLQGVPRSVLEAAEVDGVTGFKRFFHITLPLIRHAIVVAVLFRALDALRIFDLPFVLTSNSRETAVMSMYARQQLLDFQDIGFGSAASFLAFCVTAGVAAAWLAAGGGEALDSREGQRK